MTIPKVKKIAILGSTGSIGQSTLDVVRSGIIKGKSRFEVFGISGHSRLEQLWSDAKEFGPKIVVGTDPESAAGWPGDKHAASDFQGDFLVGADAAVQLAANEEVDVVVAAMVGSAGLPSTLAAIEAGKTIALANKETMVAAGHLCQDLLENSGATILPVDSEHSAIFQAAASGRKDEIRRVVLTASGGPFLDLPADKFEEITPKMALAHPTWDMGAKISIDSATMMNKALEVIEAKWLFDLPAEKIDVVVHRQSIVHSFVEFVDGSVLAQLSPPDMRLPIQYALDYPDRIAGPAKKMDFSRAMSLDFQPPDMDRFPALVLGLEVAKAGGSCGVVLNAANEVAVEAFLGGRIRFGDIPTVCRRILDQHNFQAHPTLEAIFQLDRWARQETLKCIGN